MEKVPGGSGGEGGVSAHTASADGRAHCVAITWHSSSLGMLRRPRPTSTTSNPLPGLLEPVGRRWRCCFLLLLLFFFDLHSQAKGKVGRQQRKGGCCFFTDMSLVISTQCFCPVTAQHRPDATDSTTGCSDMNRLITSFKENVWFG